MGVFFYGGFMWTASIGKVEKADGIIALEVSYTDGVQIINRIYKPMMENANTDWLADQVKQQIDELTKLDAVNVSAGSINPVAKPPVISDEQKFINELNKLRNINLLNELKVTAIDATDLVTWLTTNFRESYLDRILF